MPLKQFKKYNCLWCASFWNVTHPMMNRALSFNFNQAMQRSFVLGAVSAIVVLAGWAPDLTAKPAKLFSSAAYAQSEDTFTRYVRAAVALEQKRQGLEAQVRQLTGGSLPADVCRNVGQLNPSIQGQVSGICQQFSADAAQIIFNQQKLSRDEFRYYQSQSTNRDMCKKIADKAAELKIGTISCENAR